MTWKTDGKIINPYNFIKLYGECKRGINGIESRKNKNLHTGVINCSLITKTPLFIPNTTTREDINGNLNVEFSEHKVYDFFSYEDLSKNGRTKIPIIPGSSIRGVIRSTYEILTRSCFSVVDYKQNINKRMPDSGLPGIIKRENNKYVLYSTSKATAKIDKFDWSEKYECEELWIRTKKSNKNPHIEIVEEIKETYDKVDEELSDKIDEKVENNFKKGYLLKGGMTDGKKNYSIFIAEFDKKVKELNDKELEKLDNLLKLYMDNEKNDDKETYKQYKEAFDKLKKGDIKEIPIYYKKLKDMVYLSPACITQELYDTSIEKILNAMGKYIYCNDAENICEACDLFGMVGGKQALSSKVRITDANLKSKEDDVFEKFLTLSELSSPKISATEFYLNRPDDSDIWTYDYSRNWKKHIVKPYNPEIRGRKVYLHYKNFKYETAKVSNLNVTVRPVKKNKQFEFKVFFERISEEELEKLLWVLTLGENKSNSVFQHKIGMAKPLGFGSVKIIVDSVTERNISYDEDTFEITYNNLPLKNYEEKISAGERLFDEKLMNQLKIATNFETTGVTQVKYPIATQKDGETNTYLWFAANKCYNDGTGVNPIINQTLPKITENLKIDKYKEE